MDRKRIKDYNYTIRMAKFFLDNKSQYLILDTETTGLGKNDVIVQLGMIDMDGNPIINTLIRPTQRKRISPDAVNIHGITMDMLKDAPAFKDVYPVFKKTIKGKKLLIYNAEYDIQLLYQTALQDGIRGYNTGLTALCIMILYSQYIGEWNEYHGNYRYQRLPSGDHTAIGDCRATLKVLQEIAESEKMASARKWWQI